MKKRFIIFLITMLFSLSAACSGISKSAEDGYISENTALSANEAQKENINTNENTDNTGDTIDIVKVNTEESFENTDTQTDDDETDPEDFVVYPLEGEFVVLKSAVVREGPSTEFPKLGTLNANDIVKVTGRCENGWFRFEFDSCEGYTYQKFFADKETYLKEKEAVAENLSSKDENVVSTEDENESVEEISEDELNEYIEKVIALCNEERIAAGSVPFEEDITLDECAAIRAEELVVLFSHDRPNGEDCFSVLEGVSWNVVGENIAAGQKTPEEVVKAWMKSDGHRANILNPSFGKIGIGYVKGGEYGAYWVQIFTD